MPVIFDLQTLLYALLVLNVYGFPLFVILTVVACLGRLKNRVLRIVWLVQISIFVVLVGTLMAAFSGGD